MLIAPTAALDVQPASLTEAKDALVLRLKFHKSTLFLPCQPTDTLASLKTGFVVAVRSSNQPELSSLPSYTSTDAKSYPSWSDMDPDTDVGLFIASSTGNDAAGLEGMTIFMPLDHDASGADTTVRKAGLKDSDAVCVGFRAQGAGTWLDVFLDVFLIALAQARLELTLTIFHPLSCAHLSLFCAACSMTNALTHVSLRLPAHRPVYGCRGGRRGRRPRLCPTTALRMKKTNCKLHSERPDRRRK